MLQFRMQLAIIMIHSYVYYSLDYLFVSLFRMWQVKLIAKNTQNKAREPKQM